MKRLEAIKRAEKLAAKHKVDYLAIHDRFYDGHYVIQAKFFMVYTEEDEKSIVKRVKGGKRK